MSNRQVELALVSLVPTYGSDLPPALVQLAASLLAQSRHLASALKAEEEVARLYACAHIACDRQVISPSLSFPSLSPFYCLTRGWGGRLKLTLDLPPIEPRPPIPPRLYKRLHAHLDNVLPNDAKVERRTSNRTPRSKTRARGSEPQPQALPSRPTPSMEASLAQFRKQPTSSAKSPARSSRQGQRDTQGSPLYPWVQPVIRHVCAQSGTRKLAPSILAGMESIMVRAGSRTTDDWVLGNATAVCAAIMLFVAMRVSNLAPERAVDLEVVRQPRKEILEQLAQVRGEVGTKGVKAEIFWEGWTDLSEEGFDAAVAVVSRSGWLDADWYHDISNVANLAQDQDQETHGQGEDPSATAQVRGRRADTMLQHKYDLLSEARRADYAIWKADMMARISEKMTILEAAGRDSS